LVGMGTRRKIPRPEKKSGCAAYGHDPKATSTVGVPGGTVRTVEFHALVFIPADLVGVDCSSAWRRASLAGELGSSGAFRTSRRKAELAACRYAGEPAGVAREFVCGVPAVGDAGAVDAPEVVPTCDPAEVVGDGGAEDAPAVVLTCDPAEVVGDAGAEGGAAPVGAGTLPSAGGVTSDAVPEGTRPVSLDAVPMGSARAASAPGSVAELECAPDSAMDRKPAG